MIGVFKRKDGWVLERELLNKPYHKPPEYYAFPQFSVVAGFKDNEIPEMFTTKIEFRLTDFWRNIQGEYIKVFYEEV